MRVDCNAHHNLLFVDVELRNILCDSLLRPSAGLLTTACAEAAAFAGLVLPLHTALLGFKWLDAASCLAEAPSAVAAEPRLPSVLRLAT